MTGTPAHEEGMRTESRKSRPAGGEAPPPHGREEILAAAATVFMERGYAAARIDDVADRLGATKGRVYHHYRSKAELFFEVHLAAMRLITDAVAPIAEADLPPPEKLRAMALEHARVIMRHFTFEKVLVQGLERHLMLGGDAAQQRMMRRVIRLRDRYEDLYAGVIAEGMRRGQFEAGVPPRLAAKPVLGALNWLTIWFDPRPDRDGTAETIAETIAAFVVRGLSV